MARTSQEDFEQLRVVFARIVASSVNGREDVVERGTVVEQLTRCGLALAKAEHVFQLVDEDESGTLTPKEFFSVLTLLAHFQGRAHEWRSVFDAIDADRSGAISLPELDAYAKYWWSSGGLTAVEIASLRSGSGVLSAGSLHAHERGAELDVDKLVRWLVWDVYLEQCRQQRHDGDLKSLLDKCWRERLRIERLQHGAPDAFRPNSLSPAAMGVPRNFSINI